ncbi:DeoR/GlpR family DNA-binding transcription regulator [Aurantimonas sp. VKM B-3413]|uniref:DeoR/GlpR family DNA-binding transcription regulator n=1 Tax=Aurantimonas sp. VKM B-3413 TaxID=2779401 RepID=UPI0021043B20|nr:DeoR/GlpR family DNA-binding transcription regulator [Aurantimonas sp. VKM B-3413]MCB8837004.1 DeoR/GlpR family DNA-binding transcription regulator [Aurantimonas sp. VKM B-3413]
MSTEVPKSSDLKYVSAPSRRQTLMSMIEDVGFCTITELAAALKVSEMTVRRDVTKLAAGNSAIRVVHGGVSSVPVTLSNGTDYELRARAFPAAKAAVATAAARLVVPGSTIALDSGTTAVKIAEALPTDCELNVVTQSLAVANALIRKDNIDLTIIGGTLVRSLQACVGPSAINAIAGIRIDTFYLSATSIDRRGVLAGNDYDAATKRELIEASDSVVLVSDSSKFNISSRFRVCPLERIGTLVTDSNLADEYRLMIESVGITVVIA